MDEKTGEAGWRYIFQHPSLNIQHPSPQRLRLLKGKTPINYFPKSMLASMHGYINPTKAQGFIYIGEKAKIHKSCPVGINPQWR